MIEIFYNLDNLLEHINIQITLHKFKFDKTVELPFDKQFFNVNYLSLIKEDNELKLYYRTQNKSTKDAKHGKLQITHCVHSTDHGETFKKIQKDSTILYFPNKHECICHNFRATKINNTYIGVGGQLGLVFFNSKDGIKWEENKESYIPIDRINIFKDNMNTCYDTLASILKVNDRYIIYNRANLSKGVRHICYSESKDMKKWSNWKLINFKHGFNFKKDSYYISNFTKYPNSNLFIGITPFCDTNDKMHKIMLCFSKDAVNWEIIGQILNPIKFTYLPVGQELLLSKDGTQYIQYIFDTNKSKMDKFIIQKDRLVSISCGNKEGMIITKPLHILNNKLIINFKTYEDGWIKIGLLDKTKHIIPNYYFADCELLQGDNLAHIVKWKNSEIKETIVHLRFKLYKADIYSISGKF